MDGPSRGARPVPEWLWSLRVVNGVISLMLGLGLVAVTPLHPGGWPVGAVIALALVVLAFGYLTSWRHFRWFRPVELLGLPLWAGYLVVFAALFVVAGYAPILFGVALLSATLLSLTVAAVARRMSSRSAYWTGAALAALLGLGALIVLDYYLAATA